MTSNHLRMASESDSVIGSDSDSEVASNERTNERTNGSDPYGCRSGNGSRRTGVYEELDGSGSMTSEYAKSRIAEAREVIASTKAATCRHGVMRAKCNECDRSEPTRSPDGKAAQVRAALDGESAT